MTIAAMNANHEELVRWAEEYFVKDAPFWINDMEDIPPVDESIAQYTGGMIRVSSFNVNMNVLWRSGIVF